MKLADYLKAKNLKASAFAAEIGTPVSTVTRLLKGERSPGIALMAKIQDKTNGKVRPADFMPQQMRVAS